MDFKKSLITSTAIVAVGSLGMATAEAASKPKLGISGYYEVFMGAGDGDRSGASASGTPTYSPGEEGTFSIMHYGEIRFKASGKTDNGMKWGVYFEDVQNDADTTGKKCSTDEANIWMSGSWGKLEIGGQDGAGDKVYAGGEKLVHHSPGMIDAFVSTDSYADEKMSLNDTSDDTKVTYYTPRISGFQAGYSYVPHDEKGSIGGDATNEPGHEYSLEWKGKVGGGNLRATFSGAYLTTTNSPLNPEHNYRAGVTYGMGPWSIAGGYKHHENDGDLVESGEVDAFDLAVAYSGGRWEVAALVGITNAEDVGGTTSDSDYYHVGVTGAYNLGGGLTVAASVWFYDLDYPSASSDTDTDGTVGIISLGARF
jgi:hypothetical protein